MIHADTKKTPDRLCPEQFSIEGETMMRIGIAADHGGFALKEEITISLRGSGHDVVDFGAYQLTLGDDYPDFIAPLARAVGAKEVERGVAVCGSGVGASIAANKVSGVRAGLIHDVFSARQGVEDDDMNVFCLGGKVIGSALALELIGTFLTARFSNTPRHRRRVAKVQALETDKIGPHLSGMHRENGMSAKGIYRTTTPGSGSEYAFVDYGVSLNPEEIPRAQYEIKGYEPPFESLPDKEKYGQIGSAHGA
jgi:ribose 5-phosphate isomerase B